VLPVLAGCASACVLRRQIVAVALRRAPAGKLRLGLAGAGDGPYICTRFGREAALPGAHEKECEKDLAVWESRFIFAAALEEKRAGTQGKSPPTRRLRVFRGNKNAGKLAHEKSGAYLCLPLLEERARRPRAAGRHTDFCWPATAVAVG